MLVATCNVNGIRAAVRKGMQDWIASVSPDVLLLQEVRAPEDLVPDLVGDQYQIVQQACEIKGRAGVAIAVKNGLDIGRVSIGLGADLPDSDPDADANTAWERPGEPPVDTGRWVEVDIPQLHTTFISAYLHSGNASDEPKMAAKYAHLDRVSTRLQQLQVARPVDMPHIVMAGDFNIVHTERDITNWRSNHNKTSGVLDPEIAYLDKWMGELGYVDVQRSLIGDEQAEYTWWSQRGKAFDNNVGWRIDYQLASPDLAMLAQSVRIDRATSYDQRWSDHAPLLVTYDVEN
ncbi:endonuclease/exonuclease/phosphatase family protein [Arcanobacterium phocisimile]|uniref:Endonuclease/exonuclease/phosphatase family protein n=1 Tax=Arcanobacterium phocisimile TaxID=1302235 RepID=A0ABX7IF12_9ACTO|nr:exodeoxyribonuclease III [Arcanobacterium phocisimile]QRV01729.1 endonuclease/exonuclease/phosphatase family protein [Arcanobacterium phocisimile]